MTVTSSADFWVPCPHEDQPGVHDTQPDHHPLTAQQVEDIIAFVIDNKRDVVECSRAAVRLVQGIPGMICPRPAEGDVAAVSVWVENAVADLVHDPDGSWFQAPVLVRLLAGWDGLR